MNRTKNNIFTLVIPNRNRELKIVERSLNSLYKQLDDRLEVSVVDFGSTVAYQQQLQKLLESFPKIKCKQFPVQDQLWNKSRAINIVLKTCKTEYFMVSDMDMIYHPGFINEIFNLLSPKEGHYFPVGVLTADESKIKKTFSEYKVKFWTNGEATGITVFPTAILKGIHGYDEFFHGWGSEDTDVHNRLKNAGYKVIFHPDEKILLHQWHPKIYRSAKSTAPVHLHLERINMQYMQLRKQLKATTANPHLPWGVMPNQEDDTKLGFTDINLQLHHTKDQVAGLCFALQQQKNGGVVCFEITTHPEKKQIKTPLKKLLKKKIPLFIDAERSNEIILEEIISNHRHRPYRYNFDRETGIITGTIFFKNDL